MLLTSIVFQCHIVYSYPYKIGDSDKACLSFGHCADWHWSFSCFPFSFLDF